MLLDDILPSFDVTEVHSIKVSAPPEIVFSAMKSVTLDEISCVVPTPFLPARHTGENGGKEGGVPSFSGKPLLSLLLNNGFILLAEKEDREIVFGKMVPAGMGGYGKRRVQGRFPYRAQHEFLAFDHPDYIRVVANLRIEPTEAGMRDRPDRKPLPRIEPPGACGVHSLLEDHTSFQRSHQAAVAKRNQGPGRAKLNGEVKTYLPHTQGRGGLGNGQGRPEAGKDPVDLPAS